MLAGTGRIGPGGYGARAWPIEAYFFPGQGLNGVLAVNDDPATSGESYEYTVENQFLEVTNKWDENGTYFYYHTLPLGVSKITLLDEKKLPVTDPYVIEGVRLYHSLSGIYWVKYFADDEYHEELLTSMLVMPRAPRRNTGGDAPYVPANTFAWTHGVIDLPNRNEHRIRFYEDNRYRILDPYTTLPNDPWYPRIRHNVKPQPAEWTRMLFAPYRPYMVGTWVPGRLVAPNTIEFERKRIWWDGKKYPDVLEVLELRT